VVCPHCDAENRLPAERLSASPKCGRCHQALFTGEPVALTEARFERHLGRSDLPLIVDFWATWCGPCRKQIPELIALYKKYNKSRGLVVIGVSCDLIQGDGVKAVAPFVEEFQINYPIAIADERLVDSMGVEAIPTTLFIGPDGKLVSRIVGAGHAGEISASAKQLLDGVKGNGAPSRPDELNGHVVDISTVQSIR